MVWVHAYWMTLVLCIGCRAQTHGTSSDEMLEVRAVNLFETDSIMHDVRDVQVASNGDVWVLTGQEPFVYRFGSDGRLLRRFGERGRGPTEFFNPYALLMIEDRAATSVTVWDPGNRKLVMFDESGNLTASRHWDPRSAAFVRADIREISYGEPFELARLGGMYVVADYGRGINRTSDYLFAQLLFVDSLGAVIDTLVDFKGARGVFASGRLPGELVDIPLWASCSPEQMAIFEPFGPTVRWVDGTGEVRLVDTLELARRRLTDADIRAYVRFTGTRELRGTTYDTSDVSRRIDKIITQNRNAFGETAPLVVRMLCDGAGRVWLQRFSTADDPIGYGHKWIVMSPDGSSLRVRFPPEFAPWQITGRRVIGVQTDAMGIERIASTTLSRTFGRSELEGKRGSRVR